MTARSTMATLITALRGMTNAGTADYSIASVSYWSDDQMQTIMDRNRVYHVAESLHPVANVGAGGSLTYTIYESFVQNWEDTPTVQDQNWATCGTATYTFDANMGRVTFTTDATGNTRYITGYTYDLDACAADVFDQIAGHCMTMFDFTTDNHGIRKDTLMKKAQQMAAYYRSRSPMTQFQVGRSDDVC